MDIRKILIGLHDPKLLEIFCSYLEVDGVSIDGVSNLTDMLSRTRNKEYHGYIMDVNLGTPDSIDISPSVEVYRLVEERVQKGLAKYIAISLNDIAVQRANESGIPTIAKTEFSMIDFLRELEQIPL